MLSGGFKLFNAQHMEAGELLSAYALDVFRRLHVLTDVVDEGQVVKWLLSRRGQFGFKLNSF